MSSANDSTFKKKYVHIIIMIILMFGFGFLHPIGEITPAGMRIVGIFIGGIYGWVTIGILLPSLLGIIAIGLTDLVTTTEFFSQGFGSQTFVLVMGMMILSAFITHSNLSDIIVGTLMNLSIVHGRPWLMLLFLLYADFAVASMSNSLIAALLFIPLYISIIEKTDLPKYSRLNNAMITGIAFSGLMGDITFPFQITVVMVTSAFASGSGITVDLGRYLLAMLPWAIVMITAYIAICKFILRIDASMISHAQLDLQKKSATREQKVSLFMILIALLLLVLPNFLPDNWKLTVILSTLGTGGCILLALFLMSIVPVNGKPLMDIGTVAKDVNWGMIFLTAYFSPIASILTSDEVGIKATLSSALEPILEGLSPVIIVIILALVAIILTNFLNNMVVAIVLISTLTILADYLSSFNMLALMMIILFACNLAYVLPSGCPTNAFCYSQTELITFKGQFIHAIITAVIMLILTLSVGFLWFSLVM